MNCRNVNILCFEFILRMAINERKKFKENLDCLHHEKLI